MVAKDHHMVARLFPSLGQAMNRKYIETNKHTQKTQKKVFYCLPANLYLLVCLERNVFFFVFVFSYVAATIHPTSSVTTFTHTSNRSASLLHGHIRFPIQQFTDCCCFYSDLHQLNIWMDTHTYRSHEYGKKVENNWSIGSIGKKFNSDFFFGLVWFCLFLYILLHFRPCLACAAAAVSRLGV